MTRKFWPVLIVIAAFLAPAPARAAWEEQLAKQILEDKNCTASFITQVAGRDTETGKYIKALVGCADRRTFWAWRSGALRRFKLQACEKKKEAGARAC